jgi:molecular chaperone HtpG
VPQSEPVKDKGYSVLYLTDEVDEFVMNMLGSYEEKELKSVKADDLGLESEKDAEKTDELEKANEKLFEFIKESLGVQLRQLSFPVSLRAIGLPWNAGRDYP